MCSPLAADTLNEWAAAFKLRGQQAAHLTGEISSLLRCTQHASSWQQSHPVEPLPVQIQTTAQPVVLAVPLYRMQVEKIIPKAGQPEYKYYLFTHIDFDIKYNDDRVIEINVLADPNQAMDISEDAQDVKVLGAAQRS